MTVRFATDDEIKEWNNLILANPDGGNILQSRDMAEQKKMSGWMPRYLIADNLAILALEKHVPFLGTLWYIIKGPGVATIRQLDGVLPELKSFAEAQDVFLVKIEPELRREDETLVDLMKMGLIRTGPVQANASTVLLDISPSLDDVLASLNQKGRHAIRRAERDGVVVKAVDSNDENCQIMFDLYKITASGQFGTRPYDYYKMFWQRFADNGMGQMFFAYFNDQVVAAAYALVFGDKSTYKDGASVRERPVYGASHLLQWHVIEWAKSKGARTHDLCGTPPSDRITDPAHPYYGLGRFKTSFNKEVTDFVGTYDLPIRPTQYKMWAKFGERLIRRWHYQRHHENYY